MNYGTSTPIIRPKKIRPIVWENRYSNTMDDDKLGRWARIAHAGRNDSYLGVFRGKRCSWQIAWVSKLKHEDKVSFLVNYYFPSNETTVFEKLEHAQKAVVVAFKHFIRNCCE